ELHVVRADDAAALVDPDHRGDVDDVEQVGNDMLAVDQRGVLWRCALDVRPRVLRTLVERDRDRREAALTELVVQCLPDRQVLAASSPGRPGDQQYLPTAVTGERVRPSVEVGKREVRRLERREPAGAGAGRRA